MKISDQENIKQAKIIAAKAALPLVQNGMILGLGSGSTAELFIELLGESCKRGLKVTCVPTSVKSEQRAKELGIVLLDFHAINHIDLTIDGADEVDNHKFLIKGGGGALLREKIIAQSSAEFVVIVDHTKLVDQLGRFPLPIEISTFAYSSTIRRLQENGHKPKLRMIDRQIPYVTENGNFIVDLQFENRIKDPVKENSKLKDIAGVLETGLFCHMTKQVIVGYANGTSQVIE